MKDDVKIVAISEIKEDVIMYMIQNELDIESHSIIKVKDEKAEKVCINFDELYVNYDMDIKRYLTADEAKVINFAFNEEKSKLLDTISNLEHVISYYKINKKSKKQLIKTHQILYSILEDRKLKKKIKLTEFVDILRKREYAVDFLKRSMAKIVDKITI